MSPRPARLSLSVLAVILAGALFTPNSTRAQDTAGIPTEPGRRKIRLLPLESPKRAPDGAPVPNEITIGDWTYRAARAADLREGVPWELIVTPAGKLADLWKKGPDVLRLPGLAAQPTNPRLQEVLRPEAVPLIEVPDVLWKQWLGPDFSDVVGIHFHELVADDHARILFTMHAVYDDQSDPVDGTSAEPEIIATRLEATMLTPLAYHLDQTLLARGDPLDKMRVKSRGEHELAHAEVSQLVFLEVLRGPQNWDPEKHTGRRSQMTYYWNREQIGRSWRGLRGRASKVAALRTSVVLAPPTRWSMLLPVPPERVTQKQIQQFNDSLVLIGDTFATADRAAQDQLHAAHGAYE